MLIYLIVVFKYKFAVILCNEKVKVRNIFRTFTLIPFFNGVHFLVEFVLSLRYFYLPAANKNITLPHLHEANKK